MKAEERREAIAASLRADTPISATTLANRFSVSRQIIVGDIALLRAGGMEIAATPRGYKLEMNSGLERAVACIHDADGLEPELLAMVDNGCTVIDVVVEKSMEAARLCGEDRIVVAGGVAANSRLRERLAEACAERDMKLYIPSPILCTDNGAMIGCAAYYQYLEKGADSLDLDAYANRDLEGETVRAPGKPPKEYHRKAEQKPE